MAWIKSHDALAQHPKTKRLARRLGVSVPCAIGHLHLLWWWALTYAEDGELGKFEPDQIADACMWDSDAAHLVDALVEAGFLDVDGARVSIHDWEVYAGRYVEGKANNQERQRRYRERQREERNALRNGNVTVTSRVTNATRREEIRKEESIESDKPSNVVSLDARRREELASWFSQFTSAYPRKSHNELASTEWFKLQPSRELFGEIMRALDAHKKSRQWLEDKGKYVPSPAKWLAEKRWRDELESGPRNPNKVFHGEGRLAL